MHPFPTRAHSLWTCSGTQHLRQDCQTRAKAEGVRHRYSLVYNLKANTAHIGDSGSCLVPVYRSQRRNHAEAVTFQFGVQAEIDIFTDNAVFPPTCDTPKRRFWHFNEDSSVLLGETHTTRHTAQCTGNINSRCHFSSSSHLSLSPSLRISLFPPPTFVANHDRYFNQSAP